MILKPNIGSYVVYEPPEEGWEHWEEQFALINEELSRCGLNVIPAPEPIINLESMQRVKNFFQTHELDALHALIVTWSFDHYTLELYQDIRIPIVIRAIPGIRTGSIVGAQQLSSVMADLEMKHRVFYGDFTDKSVMKRTADYFKACGIVRKIRNARLAVIGRRTEGMTPTAVDEIEVMRLFGIRLIHYGLDEFLEISNGISKTDSEQVWQKFSKNAKKINVRHDQGLLSAAHYLACKEIIQQHQLSALAIGSYPKCQGTMCLPIAWLNEEGIPVGCEGDVNSSINMLILSLLSELPVHFGEMLEINEETNSIITSHCGCGSPSLADKYGYILTPVRLAHDGVSIRYAAKSGLVTFVNLVGRKGNYRMCGLEGTATDTSLVFEGNPLRIALNTQMEKIWPYLDRYSFGHHWMTIYAHVASVLKEFCDLLEFTGVFPDLEE